MRVVFFIPAHQEFIRSGGPSEPILAEAATQLMSDPAFDTLNVVLKSIDTGLICRERYGQSVARLLLRLAHDKLVLQKSPGWTLRHATAEPLFSKPLPVIDFLTALLGPRHMQKIRLSTPDNVASNVGLQSAFKNAILRLIHFAEAGDSSAISYVVAFVAICGGISWQCGHQQGDIRLVVPILLSDEKIGRFSMSAILIHITTSAKPHAARRAYRRR